VDRQATNNSSSRTRRSKERRGRSSSLQTAVAALLSFNKAAVSFTSSCITLLLFVLFALDNKQTKRDIDKERHKISIKKKRVRVGKLPHKRKVLTVV
jgi:hypothetical protein